MVGSERVVQVRRGVQDGAPLYESYPIETLQDMPADEYARRFDGRIVGAIDDDLYDTLRIVAADVVAKKVFNLFSVPVGGDAKTAGGTAYVKDFRDTNQTEANKMEYGNYFIADSIMVMVCAYDREFNALSAGMPSDVSAAATAATVTSPLIAGGLARNVTLTFSIGDRIKARGPLAKFPCAYGLTGAIGNHDSGFTQNGQPGIQIPLEQVVVLKPGQHFNLDLEFLAATTVNVNIPITVWVSGVRLKPVS